jgi:DNA-binding Xre family transcriptional regulator
MTERHVRWKAKLLRLQRAAQLGRDVTLEEVSRTTGIGMTTLSNIENNKVRGVEFSTLERLADFYGVASICDLLELSAEQPVEKRAPGLVGLARSSAY